MPAATADEWCALAAGVRKPPREETAGGGLQRCGLRYGDLNAGDEAAGRARCGCGKR